MVHVRHATASGRIDTWWQYDTASKRILASVRMGAATIALDFTVCSYGLPIFGAHPIQRIDGETWSVHPSRFVRVWPNGVEGLVALRCPIGDALAQGEQLVLVQCPPHVDAELEKL